MNQDRYNLAERSKELYLNEDENPAEERDQADTARADIEGSDIEQPGELLEDVSQAPDADGELLITVEDIREAM